MRRGFPCRVAFGAALLASALSGAVGTTIAVPPVAASVSVTPVDLNTANVEQLTTVPGIGEVMAQRIIDWRDEHGPFRRAEDLMKVKGVGEKTFEKLRPHIKVGKSG